jgi:hypothetical protein
VWRRNVVVSVCRTVLVQEGSLPPTPS